MIELLAQLVHVGKHLTFFIAEAFELALRRVIDRLNYLSIPPVKELPRPVIVREIRSLIEMQRYARLRHDTYTAMGYLEEEVEDAPSQMELDWCDTIAIPIGAFESHETYEELIGCARLIIANQRNPQAESWSRTLAAMDPVLDRLMDRVAPNQLPVDA